MPAWLNKYFRLGVLCNRQCPDMLRLGELTSNRWHLGVKLSIVLLVVGIAAICLIIKVMFAIWLCVLEKKLKYYLHSLYRHVSSPTHAQLQVIMSSIPIIMLKIHFIAFRDGGQCPSSSAALFCCCCGWFTNLVSLRKIINLSVQLVGSTVKCT